MDALQTIVAAYDEWVAAQRAATQAEIAVKAMNAYALPEEERTRMYEERAGARDAARTDEYGARVALAGAIDTARVGVST